MVLGIPLAKFVPEIYKTFSKPFVNSLKRNVTRSPFWRDTVFIPVAKYYNKLSVRTRLWTQGIRRSKEQIEKSSQMSDEAAIELGAEIVAVTLTCFISFTAIIMQQSISAATEKKKAEAEENVLQRIEKNQLELHRKVFDLGLELQKQDAKIRELDRKIISIPGYGTLQEKLKSIDEQNVSKPLKVS